MLVSIDALTVPGPAIEGLIITPYKDSVYLGPKSISTAPTLGYLEPWT